METKIITVSTPKGGVGKTTLAFYLAEMFKNKGKTLVIDTDSQGNITRFLIGKNGILNETNNFVSLFRKKKLEALKINDDISLIGSNIELSEYDSKNELNYFFLLSKWLKKEQHKYDYIIIDTPPNLGMFTLNALLATEYVVAPLDPSADALDGINVLVKTIEEMKDDHNERLKLVGLIVNACDFRNNNDKNIYEKVKKAYPEITINTPIPKTTKIRDARAEFKSVLDVVPSHKVSIAYKNVFAELCKKLQID